MLANIVNTVNSWILSAWFVNKYVSGRSTSLALLFNRADQSLHPLPLLQFVRTDRHAITPAADLPERHGVTGRWLADGDLDGRT